MRSRTVQQSRRLLPPWVQLVTVVVLLAIVLLPTLAMISVSLMSDVEAASGQLIPSELMLGNFASMWGTIGLGPALLNSFIAAVGAAALSTIIAIGMAYCLARYQFLGRRTILRGMVGLQSLPSVMLILPLFILFFSIGSVAGVTLIGSRVSLIITYMTFALPLSTWVLVTYLRTIPQSLEEAGLIDGLTRFGVLVRIVLPLSLPGVVVATLFAFLLGWNDVLFANVLTSPETQTAAIQLSAFAQAQEGGSLPLYGQLMAGSIAAAVPVVTLYLVFQRYLAAGLASGAVKG